MDYFLTHLFTRDGFPHSRLTYGHGWTPTLLFFSLTGQVFLMVGALIFVCTFSLGLLRWRQGRIDRFRADVHVPRILTVYAVTCIMFLLLFSTGVYIYWVPLNRLLGLLTFIGGFCFLLASLKTLWVFNLCVTQKGTG